MGDCRIPRLELPAQIDIRDVALRDGLQLEAPVPLAAKLSILEALAAAGARRIEVTSFVSARAVPALADADALASELGRWPQITFSAHVANIRGARRALEAGIVELEYVVSAADSHSLANVGRTTAEAMAAVPEMAESVHSTTGGRLEVIIATAWDCPFDGPTDPQRTVEIARQAVRDGADEICLADTVGTTTPARLLALLGDVRQAIPGVEIAIHLHDTRGIGQANALAAVLAGVRRLDASLGGLGGCPFAPGATGNIATEELVYWAEESGIETGFDLEGLLSAAAAIENAVGHPLSSSLYRAGGRLQPRGARGPADARPVRREIASP